MVRTSHPNGGTIRFRHGVARADEGARVIPERLAGRRLAHERARHHRQTSVDER
jgi:hypothetical protein